MNKQEPDFETLLKKLEDYKKKGKIDLSTEEDLSIAVMNLISLEEHFFFTGAKTGDDKYFDLLKEVREVRKKMLARLVDKHEGETWCISKHLLAASMRLIEVGTKLFADGQKEKAEETFSSAHKLYSLFWGLRLKLISLPEIKEEAKKEEPWTLKDIVDKLVDCCDE